MLGFSRNMNFKKLAIWLLVIGVLCLITGLTIGVLTFDASEFSKDVGEVRVLVDGYRDAGGCLISDGYSWCEEKGRCLNRLEETC